MPSEIKIRAGAEASVEASVEAIRALKTRELTVKSIQEYHE